VNEGESELTIRRILVALDASTHSLAALGAAAELAADLEAELIGLFVEDVNLLHLAGLPFANEVQPTSAARRPMNSDSMEQQLRLQAIQARRALEAAAERVKAHWTFRIVRGQVTPSVLDAALEADLLAMGRVSRPLTSRDRLGSTARAATTGAGRSVLLMRQGRELKHPVLVTYDGSPASVQALSAAVKLARGQRDSVRVLLLAGTREEADELRRSCNEWLKERDLRADFQWIMQPSVASLARVAQAAGDCVLVLGGNHPLMAADALQELLNITDCPVMLVR
jgi:nucleotide-binding universal stress UspA family protein